MTCAWCGQPIAGGAFYDVCFTPRMNPAPVPRAPLAVCPACGERQRPRTDTEVLADKLEAILRALERLQNRTNSTWSLTGINMPAEEHVCRRDGQKRPYSAIACSFCKGGEEPPR